MCRLVGGVATVADQADLDDAAVRPLLEVIADGVGPLTRLRRQTGGLTTDGRAGRLLVCPRPPDWTPASTPSPAPRRTPTASSRGPSSVSRRTSTPGSARSSAAGRPASELAMYSVMWSEHCSYKSLQGAPQAVRRDPAGDAGRQDAGRHRRERRRHRHRPGLRRHVQGRVAQPPVVRRALPGRRDRRRRHRPRHPRHGRPAGRGDGPAALRPARRRRHPPRAARDRGRRRRLRQLPRPAQHRRRGGLRRDATSATRSSTRSASACCGTRTCTSPRRPAPATR